ncbi:hypothetical protein L915_02993, partial [Phytophthora nicotianae]
KFLIAVELSSYSVKETKHLPLHEDRRRRASEDHCKNLKKTFNASTSNKIEMNNAGLWPDLMPSNGQTWIGSLYLFRTGNQLQGAQESYFVKSPILLFTPSLDKGLLKQQTT